MDVRKVVNGLMDVLSTGCQWAAIPIGKWLRKPGLTRLRPPPVSGVRPWEWTDLGRCFDRLPGVLIRKRSLGDRLALSCRSVIWGGDGRRFHRCAARSR